MKRKSKIEKTNRKSVIKAARQADDANRPKPISATRTGELVRQWRQADNPSRELMGELRKRKVLR